MTNIAAETNYNYSSNNYLADKMRRDFSARGINAVKGYCVETKYKTPEAYAREIRANVYKKMPRAFEKIQNASKIAENKIKEERAAWAEAYKYPHKATLMEKIAHVEKHPGDYSKREIIKKAEDAEKLMNHEETAREISAREVRVRMKRFPISVLASIIICSVMVMCIVYGAVKINGVMRDVSELESENAELAYKEHELSLSLEEKNDLRVIEQIAVNELGMIKKDFITKNYITMGKEDKIETYNVDGEGAKESGVSTLLSAISERFGKLVEYID